MESTSINALHQLDLIIQSVLAFLFTQENTEIRRKDCCKAHYFKIKNVQKFRMKHKSTIINKYKMVYTIFLLSNGMMKLSSNQFKQDTKGKYSRNKYVQRTLVNNLITKVPKEKIARKNRCNQQQKTKNIVPLITIKIQHNFVKQQLSQFQANILECQIPKHQSDLNDHQQIKQIINLLLYLLLVFYTNKQIFKRDLKTKFKNYLQKEKDVSHKTIVIGQFSCHGNTPQAQTIICKIPIVL
eukprot:TRINITY_DN576_c0_g2_i1.p2 TRINITY_DN576_c0_g2~~TRINITY_DN576_c0_g2_i1.p2  ORF type:complete len:241 (+),score=-10.22 TRINITY_DN576_c0_g2_i1:870-1592(+)